MAFNALWLQNVDYPARQDRIVFDSIWTEGVLGASSLAVSPSSPAGMSVDVAAGTALVLGTDQIFQGKYLCREQAPTVAVPISAAPGLGTRHDLVVLQVRDPNASGAAGDDAVIAVITGVASGSPVDPVAPPSSLVLARVRVSSGTGTITAGLIDDLRVTAQDAYNTLPNNSVGLAQLTAQVVNLLVPTGTVTAFAGSTPPAGWLLCDGSAYLTAAQPALFAVIGSQYDTSGGQAAPPAGQFRVPLLRGRVAVGRDAGQAEFDTLGETGGVLSVTLTSAQSGVPAHTHPIALSGTTADQNQGHTHGFSAGFTTSGQSASHDHNGVTTFAGTHDHSIDVQGMVTQSHAHSSTTLDSVAGKPNPSTGSSVATSSPINNNGNHNHAFTTSTQSADHTHTGSVSGNTGGISANHAHTFSASGTSSASVAANASQAHTNLQPYAVLDYIIKA